MQYSAFPSFPILCLIFFFSICHFFSCCFHYYIFLFSSPRCLISFHLQFLFLSSSLSIYTLFFPSLLCCFSFPFFRLFHYLFFSTLFFFPFTRYIKSLPHPNPSSPLLLFLLRHAFAISCRTFPSLPFPQHGNLPLPSPASASFLSFSTHSLHLPSAHAVPPSPSVPSLRVLQVPQGRVASIQNITGGTRAFFLFFILWTWKGRHR